jgi:hypothetical protein
VYSIAAHKGVQERLLQEVDAYGRDRNVAYKDLHMVRARARVLGRAVRTARFGQQQNTAARAGVVVCLQRSRALLER